MDGVNGMASADGTLPESGDMAAVYRQRIDDERLKAVAQHVRNWLFSAKEKGKKANAQKRARQSSRARD